MNRIIIVLVLIVALIGGGTYYYMSSQKKAAAVAALGPSDTRPYTSEEHGISFSYPEEYVMTQRDLAPNSAGERHVVTLVAQADSNLPEGGEGPKAITLMFIQNDTAALTTDKWVRGSADSNFNLSPDKGTAMIKIADKEGVMFRWNGLYNGETTVAAGREWIYAVSVTFDSENDQIVKDYRAILSSIRLTK
jgi:hypothetical protein